MYIKKTCTFKLEIRKKDEKYCFNLSKNQQIREAIIWRGMRHTIEKDKLFLNMPTIVLFQQTIDELPKIIGGYMPINCKRGRFN